MKPVKIYPVETLEERRAFLAFPWQVYEGDPYWVPPIYSERLAFTDPKQNPFFEHAKVQFFTAKRGEEIVGTIAAFTNYQHNAFQEENVGFFGFFEVLEDKEAANALLEAAENWVHGQGHDAIRGPAQFSTNDECGLLVDGFDDSPRILMTYNPRYYVNFIENSGYENAMDLWAYAASTGAQNKDFKFPEKLLRVVKKVKERGEVHIRHIDMKHFDDEIEHVKQIYNASWARNWGFIPMTDAEIEKLGEELKPIIDPDLVFVAEIGGKAVGFSLTLPDLNQFLKQAYPKPGTPEWWTMAKFAWHWKVRGKVNWVRVFALGVIPQYRGRGIDALFYYETALQAMKKGIPNAEMSWILANNDMMNRGIRLMGGEVYKTYRYYEKKF